MLALLAVVSILSVTGLAGWIHLLHGTIRNQAVKLARLEQRLACVEVVEAARARRAVECN
jgi:hypothetical protein